MQVLHYSNYSTYAGIILWGGRIIWHHPNIRCLYGPLPSNPIGHLTTLEKCEDLARKVLEAVEKARDSTPRKI